MAGRHGSYQGAKGVAAGAQGVMRPEGDSGGVAWRGGSVALTWLITAGMEECRCAWGPLMSPWR